MIDTSKYVERILYTKEEIESKIRELAVWVNQTYKDSNDLVLVGLLKGCVPFMAQLMKDIDVMHEIDFMIVSSYEGTSSTGNVKIVLDLNRNIEGKDVLIVEDLIDTGLTLFKVKEHLLAQNPKSLKILTLLNKPENLIKEIQVDKYGFLAPSDYVVGFGFDMDDKLRNLPFIGILKKQD